MKNHELQTVIGNNEKIIWESKPDYKCFILESIFNPLLPFALIWALIDGIIMSFALKDLGILGIGFFAVHLMPVWMYIGGVIMARVSYKNSYYIITDMGVYVSKGAISYRYEMRPWAELSDISMHRGLFDQWIGVGDINFDNGLSIINIKDYKEIYKLCKDMQRDIHADTMYPNDLRPETNHGYKTQYVKKEEE